MRQRRAQVSANWNFSRSPPSLAPPRTVKSSPVTNTGRPPIRARPHTTLAGVSSVRLPSASYSGKPAMDPISSNEPWSTSPAMRSRTVSLPAALWRATLSGPPSSSASRRRLSSSSSSGFQLIVASALERQQRLAFGDHGLLLHQPFGDAPRLLGAHRDMHLHRLDDGDLGVGRDGVALLHEPRDQLSRDRRDDVPSHG